MTSILIDNFKKKILHLNISKEINKNLKYLNLERKGKNNIPVPFHKMA